MNILANVPVKALLFNWITFYTIFFTTETQAQSRKPNILVIMADDLGYADLGSFGGDISTPNLDELARSGLRFSRFHTAPLCAVTRAMFLSGNNNHIAGMGVQDLVTNVPGYEGSLSDRVLTIPELLKEAGYHTYMSGKWHLGLTHEANPAKHGYDRSFVLLEGAGNHYNDLGFISQTPVSLYTEDGIPANWPKGAYSTDFYTDKLISFIDKNRNDGRQFFAVATYTSPHWPLQVDEKYWKKYEGKYDGGYEKLKESRFESLKKAGMIPADAVMPPSHPNIKSWESLSLDEKKAESRKMELYAGMVDNLDENVGRLIRYLKEIGEYDNTLIVFMADNGAGGEDFYYHPNFKDFIQANYSVAYEDMGKANSFISYGPQWAEAGSSPFKFYKSFATEGGMIAPLIISGPMVANPGQINDSFLTLMDLAPTFYELAGAQFPTHHNSKEISPLKGETMIPLLTGQKSIVHDEDYVFGLEHNGYAMIRKGNWKIVNVVRPFDLQNFELFDLSSDLAEQVDLKLSKPEKFREMMKEWQIFSAEVKVRNPAPMPGEGFENND